MNTIKVGYCVAYDWQLLQYSIPQVYHEADVICLSIDKQRRSWTGQSFSWDESGFQALVQELDPLKKIKILEEDFYNPGKLPMENEVAQRNRIAAFLGSGGWHIQLDADEYFLNFKGFVAFLSRFESGRKVNICCPMINLYKQVKEGMLWIKPQRFSQVEYFPIATKFPEYAYGRRNGYFNVLTDFPILHQSWARSEREIWEKLNNWGHARDFDVNRYFQMWKEAGPDNYKQYINFHHLHPQTWPALALQQKVKDLAFIDQLGSSDFPLPISAKDLKSMNSIWRSRFRKIVNQVKGKLN